MAAVPNSILDTTKKALGIDADNDQFDVDIIMHINSVFSTLQQLAVGPEEGFAIEDNAALWSTFLGGNPIINSVKTLMYLQVRMYFDPPTTSFDLTAKEKQIEELQWRLNVAVDKSWTPPPTILDPDGDGDVDWGEPVVPPAGGMTPEEIAAAIQAYLAAHPVSDGFTHNQTTPSSTWSFTHGLGRIPVVAVYVDGDWILADTEATTTTVSIQFPSPTTGIAVLT